MTEFTREEIALLQRLLSGTTSYRRRKVQTIERGTGTAAWRNRVGPKFRRELAECEELAAKLQAPHDALGPLPGLKGAA